MAPQRLTEIGLDEPWTDAVDSDLVVHEFSGQYFSHRHQHCFSDGVVSDDRGQVVGCVAGKDDNGAIFLFFEVRKGLLNEEEGALVIDVQHLLDLVVPGLNELSHLS